MKIRDLLNPKSIRLNSSAASKDEVLRELVDLMAAGGNVGDKQTYLNGVRAREQEASTAVGDGVAIPHCRSEAVVRAGLAAMTIPAGVDYDAPDGEKVTLIFLIAAPATGGDVHIEALSKLSTMLLNEDFTKNLLAAKNVEEFLAVVDAAETEKDAVSAKNTAQTTAQAATPVTMHILAVTACPTGIAHTYMAAETLEKTAKQCGVAIKVETRGASGVKNELTAADIANADCIIVAADTHVPLERFDGKPLIQCKVGDGINKAQSLIQGALDGKYAVYHAESNGASAAALPTDGKESVAHTIYKHLMNGVSYNHRCGTAVYDNRRRRVRLYAAYSCRIYCNEHCRPSGSCSGISRRLSCLARKERFYRCTDCGLCGGIYRSLFEKGVYQTAESARRT